MLSLKHLVTALFAAAALAAPVLDIETRGLGPLQPSEDPFYALPSAGELAKAKNGEIIRHRKTPFPISAVGIKPIDLKNSYQIFYKSIDSMGNATATMLTVMVPHNADSRKVLSYQNAQDSAYVNCAPSYALQLASTSKLFGTIITQAELALMDTAMQQGWIVIVPDHEGPKAAWLARENAAHAILDGIRAAINSDGITEIKKDAIFSLWGYSGGGITSAAAVELKDSYAPELNIVGAALGGLAPDIPSVIKTCNKSIYSGIIAGGIIGLTNQYPELAALVDQNLKPEFKSKFANVKTQCLSPNVVEFLFADILNMFTDADALFKLPYVVNLLSENNLGHGTPKIPVLVYKGVLDDLTPVKDTDKLVGSYCANGATSLQYYRDATANHGAMAVLGAGRALGFLHSIMNGEKQPSGCNTQTVASSLLDFKGSKYLPPAIITLLLDILGKPIGPPIFG